MEKIMDVLINDGRFAKFVQALQTSGLDGKLRGEGPFTVFAPTDEAFSQLPEGTMENLLEDHDRLHEVLSYHLSKGMVMADDLAEMPSIETEGGGILPVTVNDDGTLVVDNAEVIKEDLECSNGVIQALDMVLIPDIATR